jgi:hypothetical protein
VTSIGHAGMTPAFTARVARNRVRARLGTSRGTAPVRRESVSSEDSDAITRFMPIGDRRFLMRLLETYAAEHRGKGGAAPLTASALHVAKTMLFVLMGPKSGRLDHAYSWIAKHSRRVYQTACASVAQLERLGVLVVQRRCRRGGGPEAPPWVQDTNLYRFEIPPKLMAWWNARKVRRESTARRRAPADALHAEAEAAARNTSQEAEWDHWRSELARAERKAEDRRLAAVVQGPGAAAFRAQVLGPT